MSMYYNFNDFMDKVMEYAGERSVNVHGVSLEEHFRMAAGKIGGVKVLVEHGRWILFGTAAVLLMLGSVAAEREVSAFPAITAGTAGTIVFLGMAACLLKRRYVRRCLLMAVNEIKKNYKFRWEKAEGNIRKINRLAEDACSELLEKAGK